ncbi:hypothetical protein POL25_23730 [Nannocystis sp. bb15-2]|uniref:DdrB-like domain-containing protein n=1 Tax=Nannocystis bainbridge TaxID=2995303 RepID=A0ABT5E3F1_9BACT|nr:hypothetical protein [Nannocystis bainbridge]MDC0719930.1 hypothetical protein [Nannocystis bainbridge]
MECQVLGKARVANIVRQGCEDLCTLNIDGGIGGDKTAVALPSSRSAPRTLPARYVLVSAASLIASHDPITFDPRADYPSKVQERRYDRDNLEKGKVIQVAQNMIPALLQNTDIGAANGTPVVTPRRLVLSGNGRTMGTQRHYLSGRRVLADWLERHAAQFGIDPRAVKAIKDPIVVRVIDVPQADFGRLVRDANVSLTQSMAADVEAAALARQLPADVPRLLRDGGADDGLAEYLGSRASLPLVGALERSGYLTSSNRGRLLGADGLLSSDGRADLERMLVAAVLPVEVVERSPELAKALDRSAVSWLAAAGAGPDWDVRADLAAAAEDYLSLRSSRSCLAQWQEQGALVQRATEGRPMARAMLEVLDLAAARPVVFGRIAQAFAAASREGGGLFASVDPLEALKAAAAANNAPTERASSRRRCRKAA